jgi:hypothetical protein
MNAAKKKGVKINGQSLGNGTAFSAVAPSQRPVCDAHQSKIFGSGIPIISRRARILGHLTSSRLVSSARTSAFLLSLSSAGDLGYEPQRSVSGGSGPPEKVFNEFWKPSRGRLGPRRGRKLLDDHKAVNFSLQVSF